jgi:hypothetical protein
MQTRQKPLPTGQSASASPAPPGRSVSTVELLRVTHARQARTAPWQAQLAFNAQSTPPRMNLGPTLYSTWESTFCPLGRAVGRRLANLARLENMLQALEVPLVLPNETHR